MMKFAVVLAFAVLSSRAMASGAGSGFCVDDPQTGSASPYSVEFDWDDNGNLMEVDFEKMDATTIDEVVDFDLTKAQYTFAHLDSGTALSISDSNGNSASVTFTSDANGKGTGEISMAIPSENFTETNVNANCTVY